MYFNNTNNTTTISTVP